VFSRFYNEAQRSISSVTISGCFVSRKPYFT
jgi:hypothetical protein